MGPAASAVSEGDRDDVESVGLKAPVASILAMVLDSTSNPTPDLVDTSSSSHALHTRTDFLDPESWVKVPAQLAQKMCPHNRQWCRRRLNEKSDSQPLHCLTDESGCHVPKAVAANVWMAWLRV